MDGDAADLSLLDAHISRHLELIGSDRRMERPPTSRGQALHQHISDLLECVKQQLGDPPAEDSGTSSFRSYARKLRIAAGEVQAAHSALPWLEATSTPRLNLGSLYHAEEMARDIVGSAVDLVVVPDAEFMYSTTWWPFQSYLAANPTFTPQGTHRPIVLNFPLTDADRVLQHAILAHELGHSAVDEYQFAHKALTAILDDAKTAASYEVVITETAADRQVPAADVEEELISKLFAWTTELLCDALAVEWCGPSFAFALAAFAMPMGYNRPGDEHPSNALRMRLVLDHLRLRGWDGVLQDRTPGLVAALDAIADCDDSSEFEALSHFSHDLLRSNAAVFRKISQERIGDRAPSVDETAESAKSTLALLTHDILPVEINGRCLDRRGIVLGGWWAAVNRHGDRPSTLDRAIGDDQLQEMLGKALELSVMVESWDPS